MEPILDEPTPQAVEAQVEYVYLLRVVPELPKAKMPRVLFPAAAPADDAALEEATPLAVEAQVA